MSKPFASTPLFVLAHVFVVAVIAPQSVFAQTDESRIQNAPWFARHVGEGVTWKRHRFDTLFGAPQEVCFIEVELDVPGVAVSVAYETGSARSTVPEFAATVPGAAAAINGNFFGPDGTAQFLRVDGSLIAPTSEGIGDEGGIAIGGEGTVVSIVHRDDVGGWAATTQPTVMASNILLAYQGSAWPYPDIPFYQTDRHPRSGAGLTADNRLLLVVADGGTAGTAGMSLREFQRLLLALGAVDAVNFAGGETSTLWGRDEPMRGVLNTPSAGGEIGVANAIVVKAPPAPDPPARDARLIGLAYNPVMVAGSKQTVWMDFENRGTIAWNETTHLGTTQPRDRLSPFRTESEWILPNRATTADPPNVEPGKLGRFAFTLTAPHVAVATEYIESYGLVQEGVAWFGPEQNRLRLTVLPAGAAPTDEQKIRNADWFERQIGQGVTWKHHHFDDLFNSQQRVWVAEANLATPGIEARIPYLLGASTATISQFAANTPGAAVVVNGNFSHPGAGSVQYLKVDGTLIATTWPDVSDEGGIAIGATRRDAQVVHRDDVGGWAALTQPTVMASNILLTRFGAAWPYPDIPFYQRDRHPRTGVGVTADNRLMLVVVDGRSAIAAGMTMVEFQRLFLALDLVNGVNLDGGGSTTMWARGEPGAGVLNTPSDGRERSVPNAVAVVASPQEPTLDHDARFLRAQYQIVMLAGETRPVRMDFANAGNRTWAQNVALTTSEPTGRISLFRTPSSWVALDRPTTLDQAAVAPGETGTFTFSVTAPIVAATTHFVESFGLIEEEEGAFGPPQNRIRLTVLPPGGVVGDILIESRAGGQNHQWYSESGAWADSAVNCTALGCTPGIGMRYASTWRTVAGLKKAAFTPLFAAPGTYNIAVTWGAGGLRRDPITYRVHHAGGQSTVFLNQAASSNVWHSLGTYRFRAGTKGYVEVTNEHIDMSGSMLAAAALFTEIPQEAGGSFWIVGK